MSSRIGPVSDIVTEKPLPPDDDMSIGVSVDTVPRCSTIPVNIYDNNPVVEKEMTWWITVVIARAAEDKLARFRNILHFRQHEVCTVLLIAGCDRRIYLRNNKERNSLLQSPGGF
jgi:hypothetical protein